MIRQALEDNQELRLQDPAELLAELADWYRSLDGDNSAQYRLHRSYTGARDRLGAAHAELGQQLTDNTAARDTLLDERRRLQRGEITAPPPPYSRAAAVLVRSDAPCPPPQSAKSCRPTAESSV